MIKHIKFGAGDKKVVLLVPTKDFNKRALLQHYVNPLQALGVSPNEIIAFNLEHTPQGKVTVSGVARPYLEKLEKLVSKSNITHMLVCESTYFKALTTYKKIDRQYGYGIHSIWNNAQGDAIKAYVCPNYQALFYNPNVQQKIDLALKGLANNLNRRQPLFDQGLVDSCFFPGSPSLIKDHITLLYGHKELTCDIEAYSLNVDKAGLASIAFAWSEKHAVSFHIGNNEITKTHLRHFFTHYKGKLIFHNAPYDVKVIIWNLFMKHPRDYKGMLEGLHAMFRNLEDTKILAYLALNTTADLSLSLKDLAYEFAGNWALEDLHNIIEVPLEDLVRYNAVDALSTKYVWNKYRDIVKQEQEQIYQDLFKPALKTITQMELCGMPMNFGRVLRTEEQLDDIARAHHKAIMNHPLTIAWEDLHRDNLAEKANKKLKKLRKTRLDFISHRFNPGSNPQLAHMLYDYLALPVIDLTEKGNPATGNKTLRSLTERLSGEPQTTERDLILELLDHIIEWVEVTKILSTFIPAFKNSTIEKDGWHYLHGGFNLGGTKSGRLSSSKPNLQNLPSTGTKYAKAIKSCFMAPPFPTESEPYGWLMVGADFASLEDRISALLTKDPNKLKIYTDGYDGHCLRAYNYFKDQMPDIDPNDVDSINSIAKKYPDLRQASKSPTFLLTYMGTAVGLRKTFGFSVEMATQIEQNYHEMYQVSDDWVMDRIREASKTGYVELAFGLRLRTPILPQVVMDSDSMPYQAHQEIKTAGNALGQSYGLLNTRAANEFMERVWKSEYATAILPTCQIHDSLYFMVHNNLGCLKFVNDNLIECMRWNELEPIQHPEVKLEASLEVYHPDWAHPLGLPNNTSLEEIQRVLSTED